MNGEIGMEAQKLAFIGVEKQAVLASFMLETVQEAV